MYSRRNPLALFNLLKFFRLSNPTKTDKIINAIGWIASRLALIGLLLTIKPLPLVAAYSDAIYTVIRICLLAYFIAIIYLGTRYLGELEGTRGVGAQFRNLARHLLLYGLLPAIIITAIIWMVVAVFIHPDFSNKPGLQ